jgi:hypothetical protein
LTYNGQTKCITEWAEELGIYKGTIKERIKRGWSAEKALTTPLLQESWRKGMAGETRHEASIVQSAITKTGVP